MPVILANCLLTIYRARFNSATLATSAPQPYLTGVVGHIAPAKASAYLLIPDGGAVKSLYQVDVETFTDINMGDRITAITLLDGVTPWPGDYPQGAGVPGSDPTSVWDIVFVQESAPGILAHRMLYIQRSTGQGPNHATAF